MDAAAGAEPGWGCALVGGGGRDGRRGTVGADDVGGLDGLLGVAHVVAFVRLVSWW